MSKQQSNFKNYILPRHSIVLLLIFCFLTGASSHLIIYFHQLDSGIRVLHSLLMGLCYDLMIAFLITFFAVISLFFVREKFERHIIIFIFITYSFILFIDINYYFVFGTHLPFHTKEYLTELEFFLINIMEVVGNYTFILIFFIPNIIFIFLIWNFSRGKRKISTINLSISLLYTIIFGSFAGVYPNSYVSKNMNDPLTSSAVNYFYWSRHMVSDEKFQKPSASLKRVITKLPGEIPENPIYEDLPLARHHSSESCRKSNFQDPLASALCSEKNMNVLLILLESFRAADMDSFGSELVLTPNF